MSDIRINFSERLTKLLKKLEEDDNYVAFELLYIIEPKSKYFNGLKVSYVDFGTSDYTFSVIIDGRKTQMRIFNFIRYYFKDIFSNDEIGKFIRSYNAVKSGVVLKPGKKIEVGEFKYNPSDPRSTFLSMVTKTYPHGHEEEVLKFLPDLNKDKHGNYYKIIGENPITMFTSHLDTADREQKVTNLFSREDSNGDEIIYTDGSSILGADDKAGVTIMLYMMNKKIPGLYYFFIGEERGGIGSNALSSEYDSVDYLRNIKSCVSFDRRRTGSVITKQLGRTCCSNEFGTALCEEYNKSGLNLSLDPTGIYTDSASFMDDIPECTNISVGYENEHSGREIQNMTFLIKLCDASVKVNWGSLPIVRKAGLDQELVKKHKNLINDIKKTAFGLDVKMIGLDNKLYIKIDMDEPDIDSTYDSLIYIQTILNKHKIQDDVLIDGSEIKIKLE